LWKYSFFSQLKIIKNLFTLSRWLGQYCNSIVTGEKKKEKRDTYRCTCQRKEICSEGHKKYIWERTIEAEVIENVISKISLNEAQTQMAFDLVDEVIMEDSSQLTQESAVIKKELEKKRWELDKIEENMSFINTVSIETYWLEAYMEARKSFQTTKQTLQKDIQSKEDILSEINNKRSKGNEHKNIKQKVRKIYYSRFLINFIEKYEGMSPEQKNFVFSSMLEHIWFDWKNKTLDWTDAQFKPLFHMFSLPKVRHEYISESKEKIACRT